jgi:replicative superfamily II helicase
MEPTTKKLRPYQVKLVTDVCRATEDDVLVEQPTGSGKTVQIVTLAAMHCPDRYFGGHAPGAAVYPCPDLGTVLKTSEVLFFL